MIVRAMGQLKVVVGKICFGLFTSPSITLRVKPGALQACALVIANIHDFTGMSRYDYVFTRPGYGQATREYPWAFPDFLMG